MDYRQKGRELLLNNVEEVSRLKIYAEKVENSSRKAELLKVHRSYPLFRELITLYAVRNIFSYLELHPETSFASLQTIANAAERGPWCNVGGQQMKASTLQELKDNIRNGKISSWDQLHENYRQIGEQYPVDKLQHAIGSMCYIQEKTFTADNLKKWLEQSVHTQEVLTDNIYRSREKDYQNPFRKMTYENDAEMDVVTGKLESNAFIQQTIADLKSYKERVSALIEKWKL